MTEAKHTPGPVMTEALPQEGWIVADADGARFRMWGDSGPEWTQVRDDALAFARKRDAERFAENDEDAWRIIRVHYVAAEHRAPITDDDLRTILIFAQGCSNWTGETDGEVCREEIRGQGCGCLNVVRTLRTDIEASAAISRQPAPEIAAERDRLKALNAGQVAALKAAEEACQQQHGQLKRELAARAIRTMGPRSPFWNCTICGAAHLTPLNFVHKPGCVLSATPKTPVYPDGDVIGRPWRAEASERSPDRVIVRRADGAWMCDFEGDEAEKWGDLVAVAVNCFPSDIYEQAADLLAALKLAVGHIEHMATFVGGKGLGYSFEALGEDLPGIRAALAKATGGAS